MNIPNNFSDIVSSGYVGYPINPLENSFNPSGAQSLVGNNLNAALSGLGELAAASNSIFSSLASNPFISAEERQFYEINLISPKLNGLTSYNPLTQSNGDLIDPRYVINYEQRNIDPALGVNYTSRPFLPAYS